MEKRDRVKQSVASDDGINEFFGAKQSAPPASKKQSNKASSSDGIDEFFQKKNDGGNPSLDSSSQSDTSVSGSTSPTREQKPSLENSLPNDAYVTKLNPTEEKTYQQWAKRNKLEVDQEGNGADYDNRGLFKKMNGKDLPEGHSTDQFKRPNHITFSTDSQYSDSTKQGGKWEETKSGWQYTPSPYVLSQHSPQELKDYFAKNEPDAKLILPAAQATKPNAFNSLTLSSSQLQDLFDAPKNFNTNPTPKVDSGEFLAKDIDTHAPNIFSNIAKATGRALPVADKMSEFDRQQIAKEAKLSVLNDPKSMADYTSTRVKDLRKGIAELETEKLKYVDIDPEQAVKTVINQDAYDKASVKIAEKQKYVNDLKNHVAEVAANKIMSETNLTNFNPKDIGRKIVQIADPELNAQFEQAEKGGTIPGGRRAELERLGINAARDYLNNNPDLANADAAKKFLNDAETTFDQRNVEATAARVRTKLGQYFYNKGGMQDKSGVFGYSQKNLEDAINDPAVGLTPSELQNAKEYVLPTEKRIFGTDIPGSGFARSFRNAVEKSAEGTVKSLFDITGSRSSADIASDNLAQLENTRYQELKNRTWLSRRMDGIGDITGQVAMMALTSKGLGALSPKGGVAARLIGAFGAEEGVLGKAMISGSNSLISSENVGLFVNSYLSAYDNYRQQSTELFPGDLKAQEFHSKTMAFAEGLSEKIFNDQRILKAFAGELSPTVKDITKRYLSGAITEQVAKQELRSGFMTYAKQFAKEGTKSTVQESFEEAIVDGADGLSQSVFGGTPFDIAKTGQKALNTFLTTAMNSPLVAGMAAHGSIRENKQTNAFYKTTLGNMAANPGAYLSEVDALEANKEITTGEANDKRKIINTASSVLKELPPSRTVEPTEKDGVASEVPFSQAETTSYILHGVNQNILQEKIDNAKTPSVIADLKKQLNRSLNIQKGIYDGTVQVSPDLLEVATDEKDAEKLNIPLVEPSAPVVKGTPEVVTQAEPLSIEPVTMVGVDEISQPIELNPTGETQFVPRGTSEQTVEQNDPETSTNLMEGFKADYESGSLEREANITGDRNLGIFNYKGKIVKIVKAKRKLSEQSVSLMNDRLSSMDNVFNPLNTVVLSNGNMAIMMDKAPGVDAGTLTDQQINEIPQAHWDKFEADVRQLSEKGVKVDLTKRSNFFYDKEKGFQFIDIDNIQNEPTQKFFTDDNGKEKYYPFERMRVLPKDFTSAKNLFLGGTKNETEKTETQVLEPAKVEAIPEKPAPRTFREYQNQEETGHRNFRDYIDDYDGEASEFPDDQEFQDEKQVNSFRVDNTQSPSELAAIVVDENDHESEASKKAAEKFKQITGEELTPEKIEDAVNSVFDKLPDEQKQLLNESSTTSDPAPKTVQEQPVKSTPTESENNPPARKVGEPDKPAKQGTAESGQGTGITHAATEETRKEFGLGDPYEKSYKSDKELEAQADAEIKNGFDVEKLIGQMEKGKLPSDIETTILKKYKADLEGQLGKNPTNETLGKLKRLIKASDVAGSQQGRDLRARQGFAFQDDSLSGYFAREFDSAGTSDLTDEQKSQVQKEHTEISAAEKAYQDKIKKLEADLKKAQAEQTVKKESSKKKGKKTHEDFVKERQQIVTDIRDKLRQARSQNNIVILPYVKELVTIAPDVAKLTANLVSEGVTKLADVVSSIHTTLKESIPEITEQDVMDLIAGEYNEKKPSKNDLAKSLYDLKQEAKLVNRLADLENGIEPTKKDAKAKRSKEIEDLKAKIKNHDLTKLATVKSNLKTQIADIEGKIARGEFENIKPIPLKLDREATELKDKLIKLRQEREARLIQQKYANRTTAEKVKDLALETVNIPRSIMSSLDFSALLRQGLIPTVTHPVLASKATVEMFRQAASQERFDRWFHDLRESPRFKLMELAKLYVADPHDIRLGAKEESFMNNLAEKIPFLGGAIKLTGDVKVPFTKKVIGNLGTKGVPIPFTGRSIKEFGGLVKGSERAYVSYLNKMRVDMFNRMADGFENEGMTWENSPEIYKGAASFINNASGRGGIGILESAAPLLNSAFFSPRLIASRLNILGLSDAFTFGHGFYGSLPPKIRKQAIGDMLKFVGTGLTVLSLAAAASLGQDDDDKDKISVELDPRSSDFGKIKSGNTRWDIWGGFQQYIRVFAQLWAGETKSTKTGAVQSLTDGGAFGKSRGDVFFSFGRGKLAPVPSTIVDFLKGRTVTGDKVTLKDEAVSRLTPLVFQDVGQAIQDNGIKSLFTVGIPSTFGVGVQNYGPRGFNKVDKQKDPTYKFLYNKNVNLPEEPIQGKMTDVEYKKYLPLHSKTFKDSWDEVIKNGVMFNEEDKPTLNADQGIQLKDINKLSDQELSDLMKSISSHATRVSKKELGIDEAIKERDRAEREKNKKPE